MSSGRKPPSWDAPLVEIEREHPRYRRRSMRLRSLWRGAGHGNLGAEHDRRRACLRYGARSRDCLEPWRTARLLRCREEDWQRGKEITGERDVLHQREDQKFVGREVWVCWWEEPECWSARWCTRCGPDAPIRMPKHSSTPWAIKRSVMVTRRPPVWCNGGLKRIRATHLYMMVTGMTPCIRHKPASYA